MTATLELAKQLIERPSVTPRDEDCQQIIADRLSALGFKIESLNFADVSNLWAVIGEEGPLFVFAGHTDVVPPGTIEDWQYPPFSASEADGFLYGRGAADMKGSLAAMITATERALANKTISGRLGFLITSDEEGVAINGTSKVIEELSARGIKIDYCLVGEPSSTEQLGDTIKIGRRGSLSGKLKVNGIQGHVAYPQLASNPIHGALPALTALTQIQWDAGNDSFPPTSFQISNVHAGTGANNVIPESMEIDFNLRFSTELDADTIKRQINAVMDSENIDYEIDWHLSGEPFLTHSGQLITAVTHSIEKITGHTTELSTAGGTSDGRFIAPTGAEVIELGPCNATIHKVDERVSIAELEQLSNVYQCVIEQLLLQ